MHAHMGTCSCVPTTLIHTCVYKHVWKLWAQVCSLSLREPCFWVLSADRVRNSGHARTHGHVLTRTCHMHLHVCVHTCTCAQVRTHTDADFTDPDLAVITSGPLHLQRALLASFHIRVLASPVRTWLRAAPASPHLPAPGMDRGTPSFM